MSPTAKPVIAVVDDDFNFIRFANIALGLEGFAPVTFRSASSALEYVRRSPPALVIVDYVLPDFNGVHLAELIRAEPGGQNLPILFTTAVPRSNAAALLAAAGRLGARVLLKPYDLETLAATIRAMLAAKRLEGES